ncbi:MAG: TIGR00296 family protein, partial [Candidatus Omnitrophica bacterium]|nr:TIGR00296 family protein [Candidatus Omnitrophota bacterium]
AVNDPRFPPVTSREMKDIEIEISILTPFERVKSLDEIKVGEHGLLIQKGFYSGLLLPQVPLEYGWDKKTYLEHLCLKAGLPTDAYKDRDTTIYKFSAEVFSEHQIRE